MYCEVTAQTCADRIRIRFPCTCLMYGWEHGAETLVAPLRHMPNPQRPPAPRQPHQLSPSALALLAAHLSRGAARLSLHPRFHNAAGPSQSIAPLTLFAACARPGDVRLQLPRLVAPRRASFLASQPSELSDASPVLFVFTVPNHGRVAIPSASCASRGRRWPSRADLTSPYPRVLRPCPRTNHRAHCPTLPCSLVGEKRVSLSCLLSSEAPSIFCTSLVAQRQQLDRAYQLHTLNTFSLQDRAFLLWPRSEAAFSRRAATLPSTPSFTGTTCD
jgi:hypothetical protein